MTSVSRKARALAAVALPVTAALVLAGCSSDSGDGGGSDGSSIIVGTTDKVTFLDPAGSYDNGSFAVMNQVFPFLMNSKPGTADVEPDIAESAEFTGDSDYTVTLKSGLKFANGHDLTSSDVKFSFDRQLAIADENGPSYLLANIDSIDTPDDTTVVFHLKNGNDQTFPQVLSSPAGPIVDEEVFSADSVTSDDDIVKGEAFAGPYTITNYKFNELVTFAPNADYDGILGAPENSDVTLKYYADSSNLKLDVQEGNIDVAYRSLSATDIADLRSQDSVKVVDGPGGEIRYIVFNFDTMPFGAKTPEADAAKALAVRQAMADVVDRAEIATQVYKDTYTPLYSYVPQGLTGATEVLKDLYGDGSGGPDADKAKATLDAAGVSTPVEINLQYNPDHYGESSADEYALVKDQLESSGLFTVNLGSTEWTQYSKDRTSDLYPVYQLGWFPDYSDADNYLTPFFATDNFLVNHYSDSAVDQEIVQQQTEVDADARTALLEDIQAKVAAQLSTLPLLQGAQTAIVGKDVSGATLDGSFKFRFGTLTKG
ncbi:ABC transporter substrate-binding protein [Protaetiibacter mangrovi]|uniref:ABC transporter substrate-binding protein n=2 Tax=Microbacteriaceae TaxID=85023 RepID=A0ABT1ZBI8_9MICO|nr:ABC transporter substrate-binding protein [Protaetiibacter mangrovi]MCS0498064.1 ABC transporter substrate-binding protein [Protaetiibacter mangrovi]TPX02506.1 peptide ABC transporter substrate-binding protein [Schumannella luteola]